MRGAVREKVRLIPREARSDYRGEKKTGRIFTDVEWREACRCREERKEDRGREGGRERVM